MWQVLVEPFFVSLRKKTLHFLDLVHPNQHVQRTSEPSEAAGGRSDQGRLFIQCKVRA